MSIGAGAGAGAAGAGTFCPEPEPEPEPECFPGAGAGAGADQKCHGSASLVKNLLGTYVCTYMRTVLHFTGFHFVNALAGLQQPSRVVAY